MNNKEKIIKTPYQIPSNWSWNTVGELVTIIRGVSYKKNQVHNIKEKDDILILRGGNILEGSIDFANDNVYVNKSLVNQERTLKKHDIVIVSSTGSKKVIGKAGISNNNYSDVAFGAFLMLIRPKEEINPKFLGYFFQSSLYRDNIRRKASGTNINNIKVEYITSMPIPLPPLAEQERIVNKLEEQLSQLDSGVESLKKAKKQLELYRQAVLKEAFEKCKKSFALESVCEHITDGDHMPPPKAPKGIPFIMISNVDKNIIDWSKTAFVGEEYFNNIDIKRKPQKGDVLYTVTGSFGIPILINFEKDFCFQRHIALLRPNDKVLQKFLYYVLLHPNVYKQAKEKATGTAQKTVGLGVLRKILIPFTEDKTTQNSIVDEIDSKLSICDSIEQSIEKSLQQSEALRQSILRESFVSNLSR